MLRAAPKNFIVVFIYWFNLNGEVKWCTGCLKCILKEEESTWKHFGEDANYWVTLIDPIDADWFCWTQ